MLLSVTRHPFRSALDRVLGSTPTPEKVLRELHVSIVRRRLEDTNGRRSPIAPTRTLFRSSAGASVLGMMFRQLRTAAAKTATRRR